MTGSASTCTACRSWTPAGMWLPTTTNVALRDWRQLVLKTHAQDRASCVVQDLEHDPAYLSLTSL